MTVNFKQELKFFGTVALGAGVFAAAVFTLGNVNNLDRAVTGTVNTVNGALERVEPVFSDPNGVRLDRFNTQPRQTIIIGEAEVETFNNNYHATMCEYWANNPSIGGTVEHYEYYANVDCGRWGF